MYFSLLFENSNLEMVVIAQYEIQTPYELKYFIN